MSRRVLITGTHTALAGQLVPKIRNRGDELRVALPANTQESSELSALEDTILWNPSSTLSTRAALAEVRNSLEHCDLAYVLCGVGSVPSSFHEPSSVSLQEYIDTNLTGPALMLKELISRFLYEAHGSIVLVHHVLAGFYESPLCSAVQSALDRLGEELFKAYAESPVTVQGFRSPESDLELLANLIAEETPAQRSTGKWQRLGARTGLFPFRSP